LNRLEHPSTFATAMAFSHALSRNPRRMFARRRASVAVSFGLVLAGAAVVAIPASAATPAVYVDSLGTGWSNWSYGATVDFAAASPGRTGAAMGTQLTGQWGAMSLRADAPIAITSTTAVQFSVHGGAAGVALEFLAGNDSYSTRSNFVRVSAPPNVWTVVRITAAQMGALAQLSRVQVSAVGGAPTGAFSIDDISIGSSATPPTTPPTTPPATPAPTTTPPPPAGSVPIYTDALNANWGNWSYGSTLNFGASSPGRPGAVIGAQITGQWGAISLRSGTPVAVSANTVLQMSVHGGTGGVALELLAGADNFSPKSNFVTINAPANAWTQVRITAAQLGALTSFTRFQMSAVGGGTTGAFSIDDISVSSSTTPPVTTTAPAVTTTAPPVTTTAPPTGNPSGTITVNAAQTRAFSSRMIGSNAASYEGGWTYSDSTIVGRMNGLVGSLRWPGGQHSQSSGWASCQLGAPIPNATPCGPDPGFGQFGKASEFVKLLRSTNTADAIIGLNMNATAKENAALAAFFNGTVGDTRSIGVDQKGADWKTVGYWAQVRTDSGSPTPLNLTIFEFGNETYGGGSQGGRKGCLSPNGWEPTYTCDAAEYLNGLGTGASRFDGFIATRALMKSLFPNIQLGAPIADPIHDKAFNPCCGWNTTYLPYAQNLVALGKDVVDFLNVHEYLTNSPTNDTEMSAFPQNHWTGVYNRLTAIMDQFAGKRLPMIQSEYALYPVVSNDATDKRSNWALNGLVMADSIGMMDKLGFVGANQFNMFSSAQGANIYYGLLRNDGSYTRSPVYWATLLWSRFGNKVATTTSTFDNKSTLSVYGGRTADGSVSLLVINKSTSAQTATLQFQGVTGVNRVVTDVVTSATLHDWEMSLNGVANPASDLNNAPSTVRSFAATTSLSSTFPAGSMTLLRFTPSA
jgi:alpha-L-arabinofuranosidase